MKKQITFKVKFNKNMTLAERAKIIEALLKIAEQKCRKCDEWSIG